jgi:hypothetical protein
MTLDDARQRSRKAVNQAKWRKDQAAGLATYRVKATVNDLAEACIRSGRVSEDAALRHRALERAIETIVAQFIRKWLPGRYR